MSKRVLAIRKVDDVLGTVRYCPDPEAPSVSEVVGVLYGALDRCNLPDKYDNGYWDKVKDIIARLEG